MLAKNLRVALLVAAVFGVSALLWFKLGPVPDGSATGPRPVSLRKNGKELIISGHGVVEGWDTTRGVRLWRKPIARGYNFVPISDSLDLWAGTPRVIGSRRNEVAICKLGSLTPLIKLSTPGKNTPASSCSVRKLFPWPGRRLLVGGSSDHSVRIWSVPDGRLLHTLKGHSSTPCAFDATRGGSMATGSGGEGPIGQFILWDLARDKNEYAEEAPPGLSALKFLSWPLLATVCANRTVTVWNLDLAGYGDLRNGFDDMTVSEAAFSKSGAFAVDCSTAPRGTGRSGGLVTLFTLPKITIVFQEYVNGPPDCPTISDDGKTIAVRTGVDTEGKSTIRIWHRK